jgi:hypothetical protein
VRVFRQFRKSNAEAVTALEAMEQSGLPSAYRMSCVN